MGETPKTALHRFHARCPFYRCDPRARGIARALGGAHLKTLKIMPLLGVAELRNEFAIIW
ncbi:MAG: hypothetical protein F6K65_30865 [Moorea sp. SIO3C2]|nr:hypothetical protein [Moorena sp. SIO3C2]